MSHAWYLIKIRSIDRYWYKFNRMHPFFKGLVLIKIYIIMMVFSANYSPFYIFPSYDGNFL